MGHITDDDAAAVTDPEQPIPPNAIDVFLRHVVCCGLRPRTIPLGLTGSNFEHSLFCPEQATQQFGQSLCYLSPSKRYPPLGPDDALDLPCNVNSLVPCLFYNSHWILLHVHVVDSVVNVYDSDVSRYYSDVTKALAEALPMHRCVRVRSVVGNISQPLSEQQISGPRHRHDGGLFVLRNAWLIMRGPAYGCSTFGIAQSRRHVLRILQELEQKRLQRRYERALAEERVQCSQLMPSVMDGVSRARLLSEDDDGEGFMLWLSKLCTSMDPSDSLVNEANAVELRRQAVQHTSPHSYARGRAVLDLAWQMSLGNNRHRKSHWEVGGSLLPNGEFVSLNEMGVAALRMSHQSI
eukprot:PhM_4_TR13021/c0_g1_i1/m.71518